MTTDNRTNEPTDNQILDYAKEDAEHVFPKRVYEISNGAYTSGYFKGYKAALVAAGRLAEKPTEAQVEAAARALASRGPMRIVIAWENLYEFERRVFREGARAALEAATRVPVQGETL